MARRGTNLGSSKINLILLGIITHLLYLYSVFAIYFKSPILEGLPSVSLKYNAPSKRIVLIIADGLRADKTFHRSYATKTSFLRSIILNNGSWGVSHTRVPTETRVGHVSLLAGTYEDVSAITNGWKENPVDFDSVVNRSSSTWYWGHPGIIDIFSHAYSDIQSHCYKADEIDFADKDPSRLDQWVFNKVSDILLKAKLSKDLHNKLHQDKILFFLHLGGIDMNGHVMKPDSTEYMENIHLVDSGIRNITEMFNSFYEDKKTTFIVTSDHGMTPWGAHGAGHQSETETPFIAWGSGIDGPHFERNINSDLQSAVWGLEDYKRHDIEQIDIAPLMSYLTGCSIPVNSVGRLPYRILNVKIDDKTAGMLLNAKQIWEQYKAHENEVRKSAFSFTNFSRSEYLGLERLKKIGKLIKDKEFQAAMNECEQFTNIALSGIHYYQSYNQFYLSFMVNCGFIMWMFVVILKIIIDNTSTLTRKRDVCWALTFIRSNVFSCVYIGAALSIGICLWCASKNYVFILFTLFPLLPLRYLISQLAASHKLHWNNMERTFKFGLQLLLVTCGIELIVLSFFKRGTLSILGIFLSIMPWVKCFSRSIALSTNQKCICISWTVCALLISIFPQLPVVTREENYSFILLAGFLATSGGLIYSFLVKNRESYVVSTLTLFMFLLIVVKINSVMSIKKGDGLPFICQLISWLSLFVLPAIAFMIDSKSVVRLPAMSMSLFAIYLLTSISYEVLFVLLLILYVAIWVMMEITVFCDITKRQNDVDDESLLTIDHVRISFIFVYFIFLSFFGTGNIASLNSFDVASVYCFQTAFNKVVQGTIIAVKVFIPFSIVTIFLRSLQTLRGIRMRGLFLIVLSMTDLMALNFFFLIKDEGSWLDIGQSVSHFIITLIFIVVLTPFYELSYFVCGNIQLARRKSHFL